MYICAFLRLKIVKKEWIWGNWTKDKLNYMEVELYGSFLRQRRTQRVIFHFNNHIGRSQRHCINVRYTISIGENCRHYIREDLLPNVP